MVFDCCWFDDFFCYYVIGQDNCLITVLLVDEQALVLPVSFVSSLFFVERFVVLLIESPCGAGTMDSFESFLYFVESFRPE